jgi:hypothetical protein
VRRGDLVGSVDWPVGPRPAHGRHRAPTRRRGPASGRPRQTTKSGSTEWRLSFDDWQRDFNEEYLLNQLELVEDDYTNFVELHEVYKFVNWSLGWFGLDLKLQSSKVVLDETET